MTYYMLDAFLNIVFVKTYPSYDGWVALVLVNEDFELALELGLLCRVGLGVGWQAGHVLEQHDAHFVTGTVEQIGLYLDLVRALAMV